MLVKLEEMESKTNIRLTDIYCDAAGLYSKIMFSGGVPHEAVRQQICGMVEEPLPKLNRWYVFPSDRTDLTHLFLKCRDGGGNMSADNPVWAEYAAACMAINMTLRKQGHHEVTIY
jgi:hypothetical protein